MKLTVERNAFVKALDRVAKIVERRNTIPILGNLLLKAEPHILTLTGTDLDLSAETICTADVAVPGTLTLPVDLLRGISGKLPDGAQISIDSGDGASVTLKSGRSRFTLGALPAEDFPVIMAFEPKATFKLPAKDLIELLTSVAFAISTEETRYYLNGIFLHVVDGSDGRVLRAVATDGHRLGRMERAAPDLNGGTMPGIILPTKAVNEICRLAKDAQKDIQKDSQEIEIAVSETKIRFALDGTTLISKLVDGTFPDYVRVIPQGNDKKAALDRESFMAAVDRVATISSERGRAVKLDFGADALKLSVTNPDHCDATEELDADYAAGDMSIGFNARYLHDILASFDTPTVTVSLADAGSPTLFAARDGAPLLVVLMPMRV